MSRLRVALTKAVEDRVYAEWHHRCAICGGDRPHLHHIDENPANNAPQNLLPLCSYCHLTDKHDPTRAIDPALVQLFRQAKDPAILSPQFVPLFKRLRFLDDISDDGDTGSLRKAAAELVEFVAALDKGDFYSKRIKMLTADKHVLLYTIDGDEWEFRGSHDRVKVNDATYRAQLRDARDEIYCLAVELLRYQNWSA